MKILLNRNGQISGPFSSTEVRDQIYSGSLHRATPACLEGTNEWMPLETILGAEPTPGLTLAPAGQPMPKTLNLSRPVIPMATLRDPKENTARTMLYVAAAPVWLVMLGLTIYSYGAFLITVGMFAVLFLLIKYVGEFWFAAYLKTNAVRVSSQQLPEVHQIVKSCCEALAMPEPEVYVLQYNLWNSFATKLAARRTVVLFSGALDSLLLKGNLQQVAWLVGHELGHHAAGHLDWKTHLANWGSWIFWLKLWHSRRCEFTCDRIGLYCAGSLSASQLALANATVGAQLASRVNLAEAASQWQQHQNEFFVKYRTLYSTHPHLLCRLDELGRAATEFRIAN